ncbi:MAG: GNAT family N-acetyltransferase [Kordia sp.]|nr:MAG: GNAT family N-acetyltransferase [Kordia sp.]
MSEIIIREIEVRDNVAIANLIREVLLELGAPKVGTAYEDKSLDELSEVYNNPKAVYFVIETGGKVVGGAGIYQLENTTDNICELQKMYFLPEARGKGLGARMMKKCVEAAKGLGYEKCYLETLPYMKSAVKLYEKTGFKALDKPLGDTGHYSCSEWMIKNL